MTDNNFLYEEYHKNIKLQKRVISINDFTYKNILNCIQKYIPTKGSALDIGSATGTISFYLSSKGLKVDGIELSKNAVIHANLNKNILGFRNIIFFNSSIENFKTNKKYNLIICFEVLEHLKDDIRSLKTIHKYMNSNSTLAISVPSSNAPLYKLGLLKKFDIQVGHLRRYSIESIKQVLNRSGFRVVKEFKTEGLLRNLLFTNSMLGFFIKFMKFNILNNMFSHLDNIVVKLFGESQLILIAKKK